MADKPDGMLRNGRPPVPEFDPQERLFRRVSPDDWGDPHPEVDALDLPDMSVNRGRPFGEPEWVLLEGDEFETWGIVYFEVQGIPERMTHQDGRVYTSRAVHVPLKENYPHSEVQAFHDDTHIQARREMDPDLSLRWRNALAQRTRNYRRPAEN